jgi:hypothetical protein
MDFFCSRKLVCAVSFCIFISFSFFFFSTTVYLPPLQDRYRQRAQPPPFVCCRYRPTALCPIATISFVDLARPLPTPPEHLAFALPIALTF